MSGFTGGTLALWNNGTDRLAIAANGAFTFPLQIANGSDYAVVVATQPAGQTCTVTNGTGTASGNVRDVTVTCTPYTFTRRPLPAIYSTGKAVNYSPYRTAGGPRSPRCPATPQILQDLTLLHTAGFNLLRLFGARAPATDVVAEKILRIAAQNFPDMKFQLGVELKGLTSCSDPQERPQHRLPDQQALQVPERRHDQRRQRDVLLLEVHAPALPRRLHPDDPQPGDAAGHRR